MRVSLQSLGLLVVLATTASAAGCNLGPNVHGTVNVAAGNQPSKSVNIDDCSASTGAVTLRSGFSDVLVVAGGADPAITLEPGAGSVGSSMPQLTKTDCTLLQVDTHDDGTECTGDCDGDDRDRALMAGSVHARCTLPGGGTLQADVTFSGC
jgi:hypothetical protein